MIEKVPPPITEALPAAFELINILKPACQKIEIAGSLRRRCMTVGDIEIVAVPKVEEIEVAEPDLFGEKQTKSYNMLLRALDGLAAKMGFAFYKKGEKYRQFPFPLKSGRQISVDLFTAKPETFGWIWLIRTGSKDFSHAVATRLNQAGYTSEEGQIMSTGDKTLIETPFEDDVFKLIGSKLVPPELRGDGSTLRPRGDDRKCVRIERRWKDGLRDSSRR